MTFVATDPPSQKGKTDTWLTPLWLIEKLGPFDYDPCGFNGHHTAKEMDCLPSDGLGNPWRGKVWLNPPYSKCEAWLDKLYTHGYGTALIFNRCDTKYLQRHLRLADSVFFMAGRIKFLNSEFKEESNAGTGSILLSYGHKPDYKGIRGWSAK